MVLNRIIILKKSSEGLLSRPKMRRNYLCDHHAPDTSKRERRIDFYDAREVKFTCANSTSISKTHDSELSFSSQNNGLLPADTHCGFCNPRTNRVWSQRRLEQVMFFTGASCLCILVKCISCSPHTNSLVNNKQVPH